MEIIGRLTLVYNKFANTNKCINFKSKEQEDELISQFPHRNFDSNIFMQDGDTILVPLNYEECIKYNYCYFNNRINDLEKKRYFCYITNYQYVEPNVTRISVAVDTLQTFLFDIDKFRGNIERCHSARRINVSTTETPRYIINPDLYFMEDEVDSYKPVVTEKAPNSHQTYIVLTYALPITTKVSAGGFDIPAGDYDEVEGFVNQEGVYLDKETSIGVKDNLSGHLETMTIRGKISFPTSSQYSLDITGISNVDNNKLIRYNYSSKDIGDTRLYTIILPTAPNNASDIDYLPYETFKEMFPLLQDKLVDTFYIDNVDETFKRQTGVIIKTGSDGTNPIVSKYLFYAVPYTRYQTLKKIITLNTSNSLHPDKWTTNSNDDLLIRKEDQEKKLNLYPYSFVKVTTLGGEMVWKYQENYKVLEEHAGTCYSFLKAFNVLSPNPHILYTLLYDRENLKDYTPATLNAVSIDSGGSYSLTYYIKLNQGYELPSLSIYEEKYTNYLNYRKAIVDANNTMGFVSSVAGGAIGAGSSVSSGMYSAKLAQEEYMKAKVTGYFDGEANANIMYLKQKQARAGATYGVAGAVMGVLNGAKNFITTALEEEALKKQPMSVLHSGSTSDTFFSCLFETNGNIYDYVLTKYEPLDNIKSIYEQKFYNYGYRIPVDVELTKAEFFNIISNRKYFCYMEWNSLELESFIPTIYVNDIVARLTSGVRFENTSDDTLFPTYTINSNNKETSIPAKPFFVRNY